MNDSSRMVGDVVKLICPFNYRQLGPEVVTCARNGQWRPPIPAVVCSSEYHTIDRSNKSTEEQSALDGMETPCRPNLASLLEPEMCIPCEHSDMQNLKLMKSRIYPFSDSLKSRYNEP